MAAPVVFAPALATTSEAWEAQEIPGLRAVRHDYLAVPRTLDDLGQAVLDLGLERFSFCGLSLGGLVGMWLAVHAPERVDRLVLACTAAHFPPPEKWAQRAALVREAGSAAPLAEATVARWVAHPTARLRRMAETARADVYAGCCDVLADADLRGELGRIRAPTLVIAAEHDEATPPEHCAELAAAIPGARFELIAGARHLVNVEQPEAFNRLLRRHLLTASPPDAR